MLDPPVSLLFSFSKDIYSFTEGKVFHPCYEGIKLYSGGTCEQYKYVRRISGSLWVYDIQTVRSVPKAPHMPLSNASQSLRLSTKGHPSRGFVKTLPRCWQNPCVITCVQGSFHFHLVRNVFSFSRDQGAPKTRQ